MRKHFLLLFLMALLPLAGFAVGTVDIAGYNVTIKGNGAFTYNAVDYALPTTTNHVELIVKMPNAAEALDPATDYELKFYAANGTTEVTTVMDAGDYYVSAVGTGEFYNETAKIPFHVSKANLTWTLKELNKQEDNGGIQFTATYKQENFTKTFTAEQIVLTGNVAGDNVANLFSLTGTGNKGSWDYTGVDANVQPDTTAISGRELYDVTPSDYAYTDRATKNYTITYAKNTVKIKQAVIEAISLAQLAADEIGFYVSSDYDTENRFTYNGAAQAPTYTIVYKYGATGTAVESLLEAVGTTANDFAVAYKKNNADVASPEDADLTHNYETILNTVTNLNYKVGTANLALGQFQIKKLPIVITVASKNKPYWGGAWTAADAQFSKPILPGKDNDKDIVNLNITVSGTALSKNVLYDTNGLVVGYQVSANIAAATVNGVSLSTNYDVTTPVSSWTVTPAPLTFAATAAQLTYPALPSSIEPLDFTVTGAVAANTVANIDSEEDAVKACFEAVYTDVIADPDQVIAKDVYNDAITVVQKANPTLEQQALLKNYSYIIPTDVTKAALTVIGSDFTVVPQIADVQYGTAIEVGYSAYGDNFEPATIDDSAAALKAIFKLNTDAAYPTDDSKYVKPTAVGTYIAKFESATGTGNYAGGTATCSEVTFTISPKTIDITIGDVRLWNGATEAIMKARAAAATSNFTNQLEPNESIELEYAYATNFNTLVDGKAALDANNTITFNNYPGAGIQGVITATLKAGDFNDNYDVQFTLGKLIEIETADEMNLTLKFDEDRTDSIADAAAISTANDNVYYTVKFGANTMLADQWYAIVLPFATSAYDLVDQLGQYVVVNTYGTDSKPGDIKFHLQMGDIAAGVPFLIKAGTNLDWTNKQFTHKKIVADPVAQGDLTTTGSIFAGVFSNSCILQDGYKLDGATEDQALAYRWLSHTTDTEGWSTPKNTWRTAKGSDHHRHALKALEAYLQVPEGTNARITVEDFDGQTTSIQTLNAGDLKAVTVDGWYTIDGIKLQSAPTQKGIYINNGKKVVLK